MKNQIEIINEILKEVNDNKLNFIKIKKQINKYIKQGKDEDFILNYIISNKYLFLHDDVKSLNHIFNLEESEIEYRIGYVKEYLQTFLGLCWYLANKVDNIHTYQITMISENFKGTHNPKKIYQEYYKLNRSVGRRYESYTPFIDIYSYQNIKELRFLFPEKDKKNKKIEENKTIKYYKDLINRSTMLTEMEIFLLYFNVSSKNKDFRYKGYPNTYHPFYSLLKDSYSLFISGNKH